MKRFIEGFKRKKLFFTIPFFFILFIALIATVMNKPYYRVVTTIKVENSFGVELLQPEIISKVLSNTGFLDRKDPARSIAWFKRMVAVNKDTSSGLMEVSLTGHDQTILTRLTRVLAHAYVDEINTRKEQMRRSAIQKKEQELEEYKNNLKHELAGIKKKLEEYEDQMEKIREEEKGTASKKEPLRAQLAGMESERADLLRIYTTAHPDVIRLDSEIALIKEKINTIPEEPSGKLKLERELKEYRSLYEILQSRWDEVSLKKIDDLKDIKGGASIISPAQAPSAPADMMMKEFTFLFGLIIAIVVGLFSALTAIFLDTSLLTVEEFIFYTHLPVLGAIPLVRAFQNKHMQGSSSLLLDYEGNNAIIEPYRILLSHVQSTLFNEQLNGVSVLVTSSVRGEGTSTTAANLALVMARSGKQVLLVDANFSHSCLHRLFGIVTVIPGFTDILHQGVALDSVTKDVTDIVLGKVSLNAVIQFKGLDRLKIITRGSPLADASGLLRSERMDAFLTELKSKFDCIVFDGPAIMASADSGILASKCDATLLVYGAGKTPKAMLKNAVTRLEAIQKKRQLPLKGAVLNQCI
ncbi:MAG: AAA family ATPase [Candidatus Omnitrophota bacterium]